MERLPSILVDKILRYCNDVEGLCLKLTCHGLNESKIPCLVHPNPFQSYCIKKNICSMCYLNRDMLQTMGTIRKICLQCINENTNKKRKIMHYNFVSNKIEDEAGISTTQVIMPTISSSLAGLVHTSLTDTSNPKSIDEFIMKTLEHSSKEYLIVYARNHNLRTYPQFVKYHYDVERVVTLCRIRTVEHLESFLEELNQFSRDIEHIIKIAFGKYCVYKSIIATERHQLIRFVILLEQRRSNIINPTTFMTKYIQDKDCFIEKFRGFVDGTLAPLEHEWYLTALGIPRICNLTFEGNETVPVKALATVIKNRDSLRKELIHNFNLFLKECFDEYPLTWVENTNINANTRRYLDYFLQHYVYINMSGQPTYCTVTPLSNEVRQNIHKSSLRVKCCYCSTSLFPDNSCSCTRRKNIS